VQEFGTNVITYFLQLLLQVSNIPTILAMNVVLFIKSSVSFVWYGSLYRKLLLVKG